jgi:hypothetical protein
MSAGIPPAMLLEAPTENEDISFLTFPWQSGQFTSVLSFVTI